MKIKGRKVIKAAALLISAVTLSGVMTCVAPPAYAITDAEIKKQEDKLAQIQKSLKQAESMLNTTSSNINKELQNKAYLDTKLNLTAENIETATELIEMYITQIADKEVEIENKNAEIEKKYAQISEYLRVSYENGKVSYLQIIFSSKSLADLLVNIERARSLMEYEQQLMASLETELAELEKMKTELESLKASQEQTKTELLAKQSEYEELRTKSEKYLSTLEADKAKYLALREEYAAQEDTLDAELEKMLKERSAQQNSAYVGGEFNWPVDLSYTRISSKFGKRTYYIYGKWVTDNHRGIDIPLPTGQNIYASNGGTVVTSTWHNSYGYYILIDHGGGKSTLYAHNSKLLVSAGDTVKQGDVIALAGSTGNSSGSHCHFEVRIDGTIVNPLDYVVVPS